jgi:hypothetical protein
MIIILSRYLSIMNISSRLNFIKQFQLKRLSHIINHSLLYSTSTSYHQQQEQVNNLLSKEENCTFRTKITRTV